MYLISISLTESYLRKYDAGWLKFGCDLTIWTEDSTLLIGKQKEVPILLEKGSILQQELRVASCFGLTIVGTSFLFLGRTYSLSDLLF